MDLGYSLWDIASLLLSIAPLAPQPQLSVWHCAQQHIRVVPVEGMHMKLAAYYTRNSIYIDYT